MSHLMTALVAASQVLKSETGDGGYIHGRRKKGEKGHVGSEE